LSFAGSAAVRAASEILGPLAQHDAPLGALTTYRVGGHGALLVQATSPDDLLRTGLALRTSGLPLLVVGRGSNLLVADSGYPGLVLTLDPTAFGTIDLGASGGEAESRAVAGAAVDLPVLARRSAHVGLSGMEWAVGVPGSVGGAVRMNAGGHGSEISHHLRSCSWIDMQTDEVVEIPAAAMEFGYRHSAVGPLQVVLEASFDLRPGDPGDSEATIREIVRWRREHQPGGQNAGSVFTNPGGPPPSDSAGWLIDAAGLKGLRRGTAMVSDKHANFIQSDPGGSADDVYALIQDVRTLVSRRMGVDLQVEVQCRGF